MNQGGDLPPESSGPSPSSLSPQAYDETMPTQPFDEVFDYDFYAAGPESAGAHFRSAPALPTMADWSGLGESNDASRDPPRGDYHQNAFGGQGSSPWDGAASFPYLDDVDFDKEVKEWYRNEGLNDAESGGHNGAGIGLANEVSAPTQHTSQQDAGQGGPGDGLNEVDWTAHEGFTGDGGAHPPQEHFDAKPFIFSQQQLDAIQESSNRGRIESDPQDPSQYTDLADLPDVDDYYESDEGNGSEGGTPTPAPGDKRASMDSKKQCEHDAKCTRAASRAKGRYDGKQLCSRHAEQWEINNSGPPTWRPNVMPLDRAIAMIRPAVVAPRSYRSQDNYDDSLEYHRTKMEDWTVKFHYAAMKPYEGEGEDRSDPHNLLKHQETFNGKAVSRRHKDYREVMVCARISLLFPIALGYHEGGPAIYGAGGDNSGYSEDAKLTFQQRLEIIEAVLEVNKRVVMDVIEGRGVEAFVRGPQNYNKRKNTNKKGNVARKEKVTGTEINPQERSRQTSDGLVEAGPSGQGAHNQDTAPDTKVVAGPSKKSGKGKRTPATESEAEFDQYGQSQPPESPPKKKKRGPRKRATAPKPSTSAPLIGETSAQSGLQSEPTVQDAEWKFVPPEATCAPSDQDFSAYGNLPTQPMIGSSHLRTYGAAGTPYWSAPSPIPGGSTRASPMPRALPPQHPPDRRVFYGARPQVLPQGFHRPMDHSTSECRNTLYDMHVKSESSQHTYSGELELMPQGNGAPIAAAGFPALGGQVDVAPTASEMSGVANHSLVDNGYTNAQQRAFANGRWQH